MEMSNEFRAKLTWLRKDSKYDAAVEKFIDTDILTRSRVLRELGLKNGASIVVIREAFVRFDAICTDFDELVSRL